MKSEEPNAPSCMSTKFFNNIDSMLSDKFHDSAFKIANFDISLITRNFLAK